MFELPMIDRGSLRVIKKKRFFEWLSTLLPNPRSYDMIEENRRTTIHIIPSFTFITQQQEYAERCYKQIAKVEFQMSCDEEKKHPEIATYKEFCEWFSIELNGAIFELDPTRWSFPTRNSEN